MSMKVECPVPSSAQDCNPMTSSGPQGINQRWADEGLYAGMVVTDGEGCGCMQGWW